MFDLRFLFESWDSEVVCTRYHFITKNLSNNLRNSTGSFNSRQAPLFTLDQAVQMPKHYC